MSNKAAVIPILLAMAYLISGCEDKHQERYEDPPWLGGSIIETLESNENNTYDIYFALIDKAGYRESLEKGLYTVFVASDSAYEEFFKENGIGSVDEISEETARNYITLNMLEAPRAWHHLIYGHHFGVWQGPGSELGALTFRIPTRSVSNRIVETVRYFEPLLGKTVTLDDERKYVPLISKEFFRDYNGSADGSDYTYFFPNTEWTERQWYNASIIGLEHPASNGYIYYLDKAVPYIPSIEEFFIDNEDDYGVFYDAYQRFASYRSAGYDQDFNRLYDKYYQGVSDITPERGPTDDGTYSRRDLWSIFAPTNDVMQKYLDENILKYYPNLDSVPEVTLIYLLQSHIFPNFLLPSKMSLPIFDAFGDEVTIDPYDDIVYKKVLSNAAFFGTNVVFEPYAFKAVTGPLFFNSNYTTFLYALHESGLIPSLSKVDIIATIFAPTNENLETAGIKYDPIREQMQERYEDGEWYAMKSNDVVKFVQGHIIYQEVVDYTGEGFQELVSGDFIYYKNSAIVAGGNTEDGDNSLIVQAEDSEVNGILYHIDNVIKAPKNDVALFISKDPELSEFFALLDSANLIKFSFDPILLDTIPELTFMGAAEQLSAFIPDNAAIITAQADSIIPFEQAELQDFLKYHFLIQQAVFDDGVFSGNSATARQEGIVLGFPVYSQLTIENSPGNLQVHDNSGQVVGVAHGDANALVKLGVCHKIKQVLLFQ